MRRIWSPPRLLQDWNDEQSERSATWTELFFDLFLVAAVAAVVHIFVADHTWRGAGRFLLYLGVFHFVWTSSIHFMTRIHMGGVAADALRLLRFLGVLGMTLAAQDYGSYAALFAGSYLLVRACSVASIALAGLQLPRARRYAATVAAMHLAVMALLLADVVGQGSGAFADPLAVHTALIGGALAVEAAAPAVVALVPGANLPLHVEHVDERLGLVQIIYVGESIVALGSSALGSHARALQVTGIMLGAVIVWAVFMSVYHMEADQHRHALRQGKARGLGFHYIHFLLGCAINTAGAGVLLALESYDPAKGGDESGGEYKDYAAWALCAGYGAALHLIAALRATHFMPFPTFFSRRRRASRTPRRRHGSGCGAGCCGGRLQESAEQAGSGGLVEPIHQVAALAEKVVEDVETAKEIQGKLVAWWVFAVVWPAVAYILPLAGNPAGTRGRLRTTGLLAVVAAHAAVYVGVETLLSHSVASRIEDGGGEGSGEDSGGGGEGHADEEVGGAGADGGGVGAELGAGGSGRGGAAGQAGGAPASGAPGAAISMPHGSGTMHG